MNSRGRTDDQSLVSEELSVLSIYDPFGCIGATNVIFEVLCGKLNGLLFK